MWIFIIAEVVRREQVTGPCGMSVQKILRNYFSYDDYLQEKPCRHRAIFSSKTTTAPTGAEVNYYILYLNKQADVRLAGKFKECGGTTIFHTINEITVIKTEKFHGHLTGDEFNFGFLT